MIFWNVAPEFFNPRAIGPESNKTISVGEFTARSTSWSWLEGVEPRSASLTTFTQLLLTIFCNYFLQALFHAIVSSLVIWPNVILEAEHSRLLRKSYIKAFLLTHASGPFDGNLSSSFQEFPSYYLLRLILAVAATFLSSSLTVQLFIR